MDFRLTEDQAMLRDLVERFVADRYDPARRAGYRATPLGFSAENWAMLGELGLFALPFTEGDGGLGGGTIEIITVMEALGRGLVVEPLLDAILIGGGLLAAAGSAAQKAAWLPAIIAGDRRIGLAHAEPGGRFAIAGGAVVAGDRGLAGAKTFAPASVDAWIVTALAADGVPGLWLVPADAPGVGRRTYRLIDGSVACELAFADVAGEPLPGGPDELATVLDTARIAACAEMIGIMERSFAETLDYVRQRRQFGAAIGSFQAIQHRLADQYAMLELSRSQLYRATLATGEERVAAIAGAKAFIAEKAIALGEECIQLHGGMGVSDELMIGHGHKRLLMLASLFGDSDLELRRYLGAVTAA